jgi:hypothetical protein
MNMISTGTFLNGMDASNKQSELVKKLVTAWEKKNNKAARAGGVSLMALSLAACGGEDTTPFAQSDIDAATAPLAAAAIVAEAALAAAQADAAAALVAQSAAETQAATALVAQAAAEASAAGLTVTAAAATAAQAAAEASLAAANAALATANAEKATLQTSYDALVASNATLQASYDALVAPKSLALTTADDLLVGGSGADTFTGVAANYADTDQITDATVGDGDVYNLTLTGAATPVVANVETVNITIESTTARTITASSMTGVDTLTINKGDVLVGGTTVVGDKTVDINAMDAADVKTVNIGAGVTAVAIDQTITSGATINADTASGNVTILGGGIINAAGAGVGDTVQVTAMSAGGTAATRLVQNAKDITVNTNAATLTLVNGGGSEVFAGALNLTANGATSVTVPNATGGITLSATADNAQVRVDNIDVSGGTLTLGTGIATAGNSDIDLDLDGTTATTDAVTIAAAGTIDLDTTGTGAHEIETVNLSGTTAAVTYQMVSSAPNIMNVSGSQNVTVSNTTVNSAGLDFNDNSTATTTYSISGAAGADRDISDIGADIILVTGDLATAVGGDTLVVGNGATVHLGADQTDLEIHADVAASTLNLATADDTAASGATIAITTAATNFATNLTTVNLDATVGTYTATATALAGTGSTMNVTGNKAVDVGDFTGVTYNGGTSSGAQTINTAAGTTSITTGSGADTVTADIATKIDVSTGTGIDTINMSNGILAESTANAGGGGDTINVTDVSAIVLLGGSGNDTIALGTTDSDAIIDGGGDTDTVSFGGATLDFSNNANFKMLNIENLSLATNAVLTFTSTQFALDNTFTATGTAAATDTITIAGTASADTIDASGVTLTNAAMIMNGAGGNDTITGTASGDTISGGAGADVLAGGSGTDTVTYAGAANTADTGTQTGIAINIGLTAVNSTTIATNMGSNGFTSAGVTSVGAGKAEYVYASSAATNSANGDTLSGFENIIGSDGGDYIVGSANGNTITGGLGADYIVSGAGVDNFVFTGALTADTTDFTQGTDNLHIDISSFETAGAAVAATTMDLVELQDASATAAGDTIVIQEIADQGGGSAVAAGAAANVFVLLSETYATATAAAEGIAVGDHELTVAAGVDADDAFLIVYSDGTNGKLALVSADVNIGADAATGELVAQDIAILDANAAIATGEYAVGDFAFIA